MHKPRSEMAEKAAAAFRAAMLEVIETCRRTQTPLITTIDGKVMEIPHDEIEKYIDIAKLREPEGESEADA